MSESPNGFQVPEEQDFDTVSFQGSMQQILSENIGNYVVVEFLIGSNTTETKQGVLFNVGAQFLVLFDDINLNYVVCDMFAVKFVTFLLPNFRPGQVPMLPTTIEELQQSTDSFPPNMPPAPTQPTLAPRAPVSPARAAYTYAARNRQ